MKNEMRREVTDHFFKYFLVVELLLSCSVLKKLLVQFLFWFFKSFFLKYICCVHQFPVHTKKKEKKKKKRKKRLEIMLLATNGARVGNVETVSAMEMLAVAMQPRPRARKLGPTHQP